MQVSKKEGKILDNAINDWLANAVISEQESIKLKNTIEVTSFDWKKLAKYSFWIAIVCIVISLVAAISVVFLGLAFETDSGHFSLLLLLAAIVYGILGLWFPEKLVWVFCLLSLGSWFGAETGYASGWGAYYLGMNYPLRFVLFGFVLIFCGSYIFNKWQSKKEFLNPTKAVGLLYLFVALWIMSIFGNYGDIDVWEKVEQIELLHWALLFALAALAAIYHGVKYDDGMTRGFGLAFIFLNLYTRYFEYFWNATHKAVFFAILAASFWYLRPKAEKIWRLSLIKNITNKRTKN